MKDKSILFISPVFAPYKGGGGVTQVALDYAKGLAERGYKVQVATTCFEGLKKHENVEGIDVTRFESHLKILLKFNLYIPKGFYSWLKKHIMKYDVIFVHDVYTLYGYIVAKLCKKYHKPYFVMPHGMGCISKQRNKVFLKKLFIFLFSAFVSKNATKVIFCSENEKNNYEIPYTSGEVVTNGINQDKREEDLSTIKESEINDFRKKYNLGSKKIIFSMGRLVNVKRFDKTITYLKEFLNNNKDYILLLIGPDGGEVSNLKNLITAEGLNSNVKIIEGLFGKEKSIIFKISKLFVLSSDLEGFPIVICEAISSRLPCLLSEGCNVSGSDGFVEIFKNKKDFTEKLNKLLSDDINVNQEYFCSFNINKTIEKLDLTIGDIIN